LWDFQKKIIPDRAIVKEKLKLVGYKHIVIDKEASTVFLKTKGIQIDLGGIIKGFAADKAVEILKQQGIKAGIVAVAGDIKTFGIRPDGGLWKVGIQNPRQQTDKDEITATIAMTDMAISTSGDYQKFFIKSGKRYHHLLNPKTGYPDNECRSVTIIAKDSAFTDAFATGIFILEAKKGMDTLNRLGLDGIIVDKDGKIHVTQNLRGKVEFKRDK
jgi:thiamine biosynthesis lipoprotein